MDFVVYLLSLVVNDSCSASLLCNLGLGVFSSFSPLGDLLGAVNHSPLEDGDPLGVVFDEVFSGCCLCIREGTTTSANPLYAAVVIFRSFS